MDEVVVEAADASQSARAAALAAELGLAWRLAAGESLGADAVVLVVGPGGLALRRGAGPLVTAADASLVPREVAGPDPLWRLTLRGEGGIVDATAGLGADAFHLAARGAAVTLVERSPVVAALLSDALARASEGALGPATAASAARVRLVVGDAVDVLGGDPSRYAVPGAATLSGGPAAGQATARPAVVYLDPMFADPVGSALPPKGMALLRDLVGGEPDSAAALLGAARSAATRRVVVKRHARSPFLAGARPSGSVRLRTVRFDVYAPL